MPEGSSREFDSGGMILIKNGNIMCLDNYDFEGGANSDLDIEKSDITGRGKAESGSSFFDEGEGEGVSEDMCSDSMHSSHSDGWGERKESQEEDDDVDLVDADEEEEEAMDISGMGDGNVDKPKGEERPFPKF